MWPLTILMIMLIPSIKPSKVPATIDCADLSECANNLDLTGVNVLCTAQDACKESTISAPKKKAGSVSCSGASSCESSTIQTVGKKDVYCSGSKSCYLAKSIKTKSVYCGGSWSCQSLNGEGSTITAAQKIACSAAYSCKYQELNGDSRTAVVSCGGNSGCSYNTINAGSIDCHGVRSCTYSTLTAINAVKCGGERSCQSSTISAPMVTLYADQATFRTTIINAMYVYVYGDRSFDGESTIDSGSVSDMVVMMTSATTRADKSYIICRSGAICHLNCGSTGCTKIFYQCESGATCNISPSECATNPGGDIGGTICPTMTAAALSLLFDSDYYNLNEVNDGNNDEDIIYNKIGINNHININPLITSCSTERECEGGEFIGGSDALECGGKESCVDVTIRDRAIECSAAYSCQMIDILNANNHIGCWGQESCTNAINLASSTIIWCYGMNSCSSISIESDLMIDCRGASSCSDSEIIVSSGYRTTCSGDSSCFAATIIADGFSSGAVECSAKSSCEGATITTSFRGEAGVSLYAIQCLASYSCKEAIIESTGRYSRVKIAGFLSASRARINIHGSEVIVTGYRGLQYGMIDSTESSELFINLLGKESMIRGTLICRSGSECNLQCVGDSCVGLDYLCEHGATCNVSPTQCGTGLKRYNGNICPDLQHVSANYDVTDIVRMKKLEEQDLIDSDFLFAQKGGVSDVGVIQQGVVLSFNMIIVIVGILSLIGLIFIYLSCCKVNDDKQYKILN